MYTAHVGRQLIEAHNDRQPGRALSARTFFDEVIFPTFFDDDRYLLWVTNSPFTRPYQRRGNAPVTAEDRREALAEFHAQVDALETPEGHLFLSGFAADPTRVTSGQVTDLPLRADPASTYCSWIGEAASIGVEGGLNLLLEDPEVLGLLVEGWVQYRRYLTETPNLKGNQVATWNGWWLTHALSDRYDPDNPLLGFEPRLGKRGDQVKLATRSWLGVLFALARRYPDTHRTAYIYSLGNTNKTIGFVTLALPDITSLMDLYDELFPDHGGLMRQEKERLYKTDMGLHHAVQMGSIGLDAIRPGGLGKYLKKRRRKYPKHSTSAKKRRLHSLYETWIIAMLNNKELHALADRTARAVYEFTKGAKRGKKTRDAAADALLEASSRHAFIEALTALMKDAPGMAEDLSSLVEEVVEIPAQQLTLFFALLRFRYAHARASD